MCAKLAFPLRPGRLLLIRILRLAWEMVVCFVFHSAAYAQERYEAGLPRDADAPPPFLRAFSWFGKGQ